MDSSAKMLDLIDKNTKEFLSTIPKVKRKEYGQFFTDLSIAQFMASLFEVDRSKSSIKILDAGAGTGILGIALVQRLLEDGYQGEIILCCYETDELVLPILEKHLALAQHLWGISFQVKNENYITSQAFLESNVFHKEENQYDYVIGNPPYGKVPKDSIEALSLKEVCYGTPNRYFLFWSMGIYNLKQGQELVYIIPRSWTSGLYFKKFREYLFRHCVITHVHLFSSRDKVFQGGDNILQETVIVKIRKKRELPNEIVITSTCDSDFRNINRFKAPYATVVNNENMVHLVTNEEDLSILKTIRTLPCTLPELNLQMKTGLVVDFRAKETLRDALEENSFPLLYPQHIKAGKVVWPIGKEGEVIKSPKRSFLQENGDYLFIKRFTAKEEARRLQCGVLLKQQFPQFEYISTQNKINFIRCDSTKIAFGLYALFNSSLYDNYYRILNGSTQVNATEINLIRVPDRRTIEAIGEDIMGQNLSVYNCNKALEKWIM